MDTKFLRGDTVYLISNGHIIDEATVVMNLAGFVTIRFTKRGGGTRVRENRLYASREEAEAAIKKLCRVAKCCGMKTSQVQKPFLILNPLLLSGYSKGIHFLDYMCLYQITESLGPFSPLGGT